MSFGASVSLYELSHTDFIKAHIIKVLTHADTNVTPIILYIHLHEGCTNALGMSYPRVHLAWFPRCYTRERHQRRARRHRKICPTFKHTVVTILSTELAQRYPVQVRHCVPIRH